MPPYGQPDKSFTGRMNSIGQSIGKIGSWSQKQHNGNMKHAVKLLQRGRSNTMQIDRIVEACYLPKYANLLIKLADKHYMGEQPRFITAVNWVESSVAGSMAMGYDIDWGDMPLPASCTPFAITQWTVDNLVSRNSSYTDVNLPSNLRQAVMNASGFNARLRAMQQAKLYTASGFARDFAKNLYETQAAYARNVWDFNAKIMHSSHNSDIGGPIQDFCDRYMNDGQTYEELSDSIAAI